MKTQLKSNKGMTLIELTVVILVLLSLISVLFIGAKAWKDGSDKATCIMNIRNFQTGARSYANLNPDTARGAAVVKADVYTFMGSAEPNCPAGGAYSPNGNYDDVPGTILLTCSLADSDDHVPTASQSANW